MLDIGTARTLIQNGEGQQTEFKRSLAEENAAIEALCAFANAEGGTVIFGVSDNGAIVGCEVGQTRLENFANNMRRHTNAGLTPAIYNLTIDERVIVVIVVKKVRPGQVIYAFNRPFVRVGKTNQCLGPDEIRARLTLRNQASEVVTPYGAILRAMAIGFRDQAVTPCLKYAHLEQSRGEVGYCNFLRKLRPQLVVCPELMSAELTKLTPDQCEVLGRYRVAERDIEGFVANVLDNMAKFEDKPKNALTGFLHRLKKLSAVLDQLIDTLEPK